MVVVSDLKLVRRTVYSHGLFLTLIMQFSKKLILLAIFNALDQYVVIHEHVTLLIELHSFDLEHATVFVAHVQCVED